MALDMGFGLRKLSPDGERWVASRADFFLPVKALSRLLRGKLLGAIDQAVSRGDRLLPHRLDPAYLAWRDGLYRKEWTVFSKPPFGGAEGGLEYLGRYSHRVAISDPRLLGLEGDRVFFRFKDYRGCGRVKPTRLEAASSVSAATACWPTATARPVSRRAVAFWAAQHRRRRSPTVLSRSLATTRIPGPTRSSG